MLVDLARPGSLAGLHEHLLRLTVDVEAAPTSVLRGIGARLRTIDLDAEQLPIRALVVLRLLAAGSCEAAWALLLDNATGVVEQSFGQSTSSGARRTARRLPLTTRIEPPRVFAWLPGLRDPRHDAPEAAYDITDRVTLRTRLEEVWWDRRGLVLAGTAFLRYIAAGPDDMVEIVCTHGDGQQHVVAGERRRRPDHVRGVGGDLTRLAWAGWTAKLARADFPAAGDWQLALRLCESGITRSAELGGSLGDAVALVAAARAGARARLCGGRLEAQIPRRVLHVIARSARER